MDITKDMLIERLDDSLDECHLDISDVHKRLMLEHLMLVIEKNKVLNLTRITSPYEAVDLHIIDSLLMLESVIVSDGPLLDIGTGAGYPGIPLTITSGKSATLLDSVKKKAVAVDTFVHELDLMNQIEVKAVRVEEYAKSHRNQFGVVVARAVASNSTLIEYAAPCLKLGGIAVFTKGRPSDDEMREGDSAAQICGLQLADVKEYELPHALGHRTILSYQKVRKSSIILPRATGKAKSEPLGTPKAS